MSAHVRVCVCQNGCQLCVRALVCVRGWASVGVGVSVPKCVCECACRGKLLEWSAHFKNEIARAADTAPEKQKKNKTSSLPASFIRPRPPAAAPILENSAETRACVCVCERISFLICLTQVAQVSLRYCSFIQSQLQLLAQHFEERENKTPQGKTMWIPKYPLVKILIGKASKQVHRENFDVLIWVKNVLEK